MKKIGFLLFVSLSFFLTSCDQDIDLTADWKDIPIVYGLLNAGDTAHYVRVEKAFQDQNGSAFLAALEPDSIYYANATVRLLNLTTGKQANLTRVDGAAEGYPRDAGEFAQMPNYLYKVRQTDFPIEGGDQVRFILERGDQLPPVTSECTILSDLLPQGGLAPGSKLDFPTTRDVTFRWRAGDEARIFDLSLIFKYDEKLTGDPEVRSYELEWPMAKSVKRTDSSPTVSTKVFGLQLYTFIAEQIEARPDAIRVFTGVDLVIKGGGAAIEEYIAIALANTGITGAQEIPVFSNLSEGRGIFSSTVRTVIPGLLLTNDSETFLKTSDITKDLNFQ
jgi:hypothetical protein